MTLFLERFNPSGLKTRLLPLKRPRDRHWILRLANSQKRRHPLTIIWAATWSIPLQRHSLDGLFPVISPGVINSEENHTMGWSLSVLYIELLLV